MSAIPRFLPVVATVGLLALTGCAGEEPAAQAPVTSTSAPTPAATTTTPTPTASPTATAPTPVAPQTPTPEPAADVTVEVTIAGKKLTASQPVVKAKAGQKVLIKATSDVSDSLHVHGYDKTLDLKPGKPASLVLITGMKGLFEVETHESGKLAFKLQVS